MIVLVAAVLLAQEAIPDLVRDLDDSRPEVRERSADRLVELGPGIRAQLEALMQEGPGGRRQAIRQVLDRIDRRPDQLVAELARLERARSGNLHLFLRDAFHWITRVFPGEPYAPLEQALLGSGWSIEDRTYSHEGVQIRRFHRPAAKPISDFPARVFVEMTWVEDSTPGGPTRRTVTELSAGMEVRLDLPFERVQEPGTFPAGNVLDVLLRSDEVKDKLSGQTVLSIEVHYDILWDRWTDRDPLGFDLQVNSVSSDRRSDGRFWFQAASGLDPPRSPPGAPAEPNLVAEDSVGPIRGRGGVGSSGKGGGKNYWTLHHRDEPWEDAPAPPPDPCLSQILKLEDLEVAPRDLRCLTIHFAEFTDFDLEKLARLSDLVRLDLRKAKRLNGDTLDRIADMPRLETLFLPGQALRGENLSRLARMPSLRQVTVASGLLNGAMVKGLQRLPADAIDLHWPRGIQADTFLPLVRKDLRRFSIQGSKLSIPAIPDFQGWDRLESVGFHSLSDVQGLESLGRLPRLQRATISFSRIRPGTLLELALSPSLRRLELTRVEGLTGADLLALRNLKTLRYLHVHDCPGITVEILRRLAAALGPDYVLLD